MKKLKIIILFFALTLLLGCEDKGVSKQLLDGTEASLPKELKGLKVYNVSVGGGTIVKIAVMGNSQPTVSLTRSGDNPRIIDAKETTITVNLEKGKRTINAKEIISENDSIIVIKK